MKRWVWPVQHLCRELISDAELMALPNLAIPAALDMYEGKEVLSLLELAIYKSRCL